MKSIVVYYSATGNTKKIAKSIYEGMKETLKDCELAWIKDIRPQDLENYDVIGLGSPLWSGREPINVRRFIEEMPRLEGRFGFPFCTHGAWPIGYMYWVVPALKEKGLTIIGYNDWYGGVFQLPYMPKPYPTDGHPDAVDLQEAYDFGREMANRALNISAGATELIPELPELDGDEMIWQQRKPSELPSPHMEGIKKSREIRILNAEKCIYPECQLCVDICPTDSIDFSDNPPSFKNNCIMCFSCEAICPKGAIEIDFKQAFGETASGLDISNHPFIKFLKDAEEKGRFRWLVSLEKVGFGTPLWKIGGHPRYVIED